jgi:hypothetical protein
MKALTFILFLTILGIAHAQNHFLVSPEEMSFSNNAVSKITAKSAPQKDAPLIEVETPVLNSAVSSPTPIKLKFQATAPSSVKPESFKLLYGSWGIDITNRIAGKAKLTDQGIEVSKAELPKGHHRLTISIEDTSGRVGSKVLEFEVN